MKDVEGRDYVPDAERAREAAPRVYDSLVGAGLSNDDIEVLVTALTELRQGGLRLLAEQSDYFQKPEIQAAFYKAHDLLEAVNGVARQKHIEGLSQTGQELI